MIAINAPYIIVDLPTESIIYIRVISFLLVFPEDSSHFLDCLPLNIVGYRFVLWLFFDSIKILMDTIK